MTDPPPPLDPEADADPPAVRFANMLLLQMRQEGLKELEIDSPDSGPAPAIRSRNARDEWSEMTKPPARLLRPTLNRLKILANLDPIGSPETIKGRIRVRTEGAELLYDVAFDPETAGGKTRILLRD